MSFEKGLILSGVEAKELFSSDLVEIFYDEVKDDVDLYDFGELVDMLREYVVEQFEELLDVEGVDCVVIFRGHDVDLAYDGEEFLEVMRKLYGYRSIEEMLRDFLRRLGVRVREEEGEFEESVRKGMVG